MDRGIPTEEVLAQMRASDPPVCYLVGTPKGRLSRMESQLAPEQGHRYLAWVKEKAFAPNFDMPKKAKR